MTIHFFTGQDASSATARHRGFLVVRELKKRGYQANIYSPSTGYSAFEFNLERIKGLFKYIKILFSVKDKDIIYLVKAVYQADFFILILISKIVFRKKIIFDFDDSIFLRKIWKRRVRILTKIADGVIVGSHYLADWARQYNKNVHIIPTSIPFSTYEKFSCFKRLDNKKFIIGWIGIGPNHYEHLKILVPVFQNLIKDDLKFKFVLIGALKNRKLYKLFEDIKGLDVLFIDSLDWKNLENTTREIQKFDVGVMPLLDDEWTRGKCAFKAIQYMACGVPVIISPVGENKYLIQEGINGFFAKTTEEWVDKIRKLYFNDKLIFQIGQKAQETIKDNYSYEVIIPKMIDIINSLT